MQYFQMLFNYHSRIVVVSKLIIDVLPYFFQASIAVFMMAASMALADKPSHKKPHLKPQPLSKRPLQKQPLNRSPKLRLPLKRHPVSVQHPKVPHHFKLQTSASVRHARKIKATPKQKQRFQLQNKRRRVIKHVPNSRPVAHKPHQRKITNFNKFLRFFGRQIQRPVMWVPLPMHFTSVTLMQFY